MQFKALDACEKFHAVTVESFAVQIRTTIPKHRRAGLCEDHRANVSRETFAVCNGIRFARRHAHPGFNRKNASCLRGLTLLIQPPVCRKLYRTIMIVAEESAAIVHCHLRNMESKPDQAGAQLGERDTRCAGSIRQKRGSRHARNGIRLENPASAIIVENEIRTGHTAA